MLPLKASLAPKENMLKIFPTMKYNGAPGGCGTLIVTAHVINSPQSKRETVGGKRYEIDYKRDKKGKKCPDFVFNLIHNF